MSRAFRRRWVEALRSGEYHQARGVLTTRNEEGQASGHCCLGVAVEVLAADGKLEVSERIPSTSAADSVIIDCFTYRTPTGTCQTMPNDDVVRAAGAATDGEWYVTVPDPSRLSARRSVHLPEQNDEGATFAQIADLIENDLDAADDVE